MRIFIPRLAVAALLAAVAVLPACTSLQPSPVTDCIEAPTDDRGTLTRLPDGDSTTETVSTTGPVAALHPTYDTSTDTWYAGWEAEPGACPTLGGIIPPPEVADIPGVDDEVKLNADLDSLSTALTAIPPPPALPIPPPIRALKRDTVCAHCRDGLPPGPFGSADIIYVHGLETGPMLDAITGSTLPAWPANPADFMQGTGYWRVGARAYWHTHVQNLLDTRSMTNRVLYVGWSSLQTMEYAAHTMLAQIARAMSDGEGVFVRNPDDSRGTSGFCSEGCVVISHSTGGPVTDVAMALAHNPALSPNPAFAPAFANAADIPAHIKVHISLGGAFSGSQYATAALALATVASANPALCAPAKALLKLSSSDPCPNFTPLANSILRDLHPAAMQSRWGPVIGATPVPVLTIAGGHADNYWPFKRFLADGLDDGVITMDSGCGRISPTMAWPTGYLPNAWRRVYDMGIAASRARRFFADQAIEPLFSGVVQPRAAAACTQWKSPTGMVQPIATTLLFPLSPDLFYPNHYSFVQAAERHEEGLRDCEDRSAEDEIAVHSAFVYTLVNPAIAASEIEVVRGRKIGRKRKWWLWKRTYHLLSGWEQNCAADYAYQYVN